MRSNKKYLPIRVGDRYQNNKGKWFTVIKVNRCDDIEVEFDERNYRKKTTASYIRSGIIALPSIFVGDIFKDKYGNLVKVKHIDTTSKITFEWEDGTTRVCQSSVLTLGTLIHPKDSQKINPSIKVGDKFKTTQGCEVEVVNYERFSRITVRFNQPHIFDVTTNGGNILRGNVHNPYIPTFAGVGILGDWVGCFGDKLYRSWSGMLKRVYTPRPGIQAVNYGGCDVVLDWHKIENYAKWFEKQVLQDDWHLDKDLLVKGNKTYGPDTCVFVPREINVFLTDRANHRGDWPIGVTYHERIDKWQATCNVNGESDYLGVFCSPEVAFLHYKERKEAYAKELAEKWKDQIDPRAYEALMNYNVEITD